MQVVVRGSDVEEAGFRRCARALNGLRADETRVERAGRFSRRVIGQ
jgi:hypothetical protein